MTKTRNALQRAKDIFQRSGGIMRTKDVLSSGIQPRTLYAMRNAGLVERITRGVYRLANVPRPGNPDFVTVTLKIPEGVICLISALIFFEVSTQVPHEVHVARTKGAEPPRLVHPPVRVFWFSRSAFSAGIETHTIDGVPVRIYSLEKTVADCFKFRNKIGLDVAIEALKECRTRRDFRIDKLMEFAHICRVSKVIRPYLEAVF